MARSYSSENVNTWEGALTDESQNSQLGRLNWWRTQESRDVGGRRGDWPGIGACEDQVAGTMQRVGPDSTQALLLCCMHGVNRECLKVHLYVLAAFCTHLT